MKLLPSSLLILSVLVAGISQAEAYEVHSGGIQITALKSNSTIGAVYEYEGLVTSYELKPKIVSEPKGNIDITLLDDTGFVLDAFTAPIDHDEKDGFWGFSFEIDTGKYDLLTDVEYSVQATYLHMKEETKMVVHPVPELSTMNMDMIQTEGIQVYSTSESEPIPEWVRNIFIFYASNEISDADLINALQYLIDMKILKI